MTVVARRHLYGTALTILLVVLLLLVFISASTYHNLNRERDATVATVRRQASTLINALEAGARAGMLMPMAGRDAIGHLIHEIGRSEEIDYLYLVDATGRVVNHSIPSLEGTRAAWQPTFRGTHDIHDRIRRLADGTHVFEVAKPFAPMGMPVGNLPAPPANRSSTAASHFLGQTTVYLGISLTAYEAARRSDLQHAMIMGGIVLALGGGVIYFFIVIRSYYTLSRTLQKARDHTRQVIASMAHGVLSIDADGRVVSTNRQALALLGIKASGVDGLDLRTVLDFSATGILDTLASGRPVLNHEIRLPDTAGKSMPLMLTVTPIRDDSGSPGGAVVVIRDMSTIKQLEEQVRRAEKLAAIGRLAAGVAHEIRNPLSSIRGFAYLLGKDAADASPHREYADVMVREIDRIDRVVSDLIKVARPMQVEPLATDIHALIAHVVALLRPDAGNRDIAITVACAHGLPSMHLDPNQITQALLNLALNAVNATESGGSIVIGARLSDDEERIILSVEDDGPGIPADQADKVFDPFFTTRARGTGLGLTMVQKIADNHGGEIQLASPPPDKPRGTRVSLILPNTPAVPAAGDH